MPSLDEKREQLLAMLQELGSCAVAFSAGVDSTVVAKAAQLALGDKAIAVTGVSSSLAEGELEQAGELARLIGIRHEVVRTDEFSNPEYVSNSPQRCYHCKSQLYDQMVALVPGWGVHAIVNGANADDLNDYRPGLRAGVERQVLSPLADCHLGKQEVRQLAMDWDLPIWDKPATPCLSSRVAYGEDVTPERLAMIDQAECLLRAAGLGEVRVRYHKGDVARLEIPLDRLPSLCQPPLRDTLVSQIKSLGFRFVTLDLEGFRSGSLNTLVPVEQLLT